MKLIQGYNKKIYFKQNIKVPQPEKLMALKQGDLATGEVVSNDQFTSCITVRIAHTKGCERPEEKHTGGTLFVEHSSGYIFVQSLRELVKLLLEKIYLKILQEPMV